MYTTNKTQHHSLLCNLKRVRALMIENCFASVQNVNRDQEKNGHTDVIWPDKKQPTEKHKNCVSFRAKAHVIFQTNGLYFFRCWFIKITDLMSGTLGGGGTIIGSWSETKQFSLIILTE